MPKSVLSVKTINHPAEIGPPPADNCSAGYRAKVLEFGRRSGYNIKERNGAINQKIGIFMVKAACFATERAKAGKVLWFILIFFIFCAGLCSML